MSLFGNVGLADIGAKKGLFSNYKQDYNNYNDQKISIFSNIQNAYPYSTMNSTDFIGTNINNNYNTNNSNSPLFQVKNNTFEEPLKPGHKCKVTSNKGNTFSIEIKKLSNFIEINAFCLFYQDDMKSNDFTKKYGLDELKEIKYLSVCDTIDEMYEELDYEFSSLIPKIYEDKSQIIISVPIKHSKYKETSFTLDKINKKENEVKEEELICTIFDLKKSLQKFEEDKKDFLMSYYKKIEELKNTINLYFEQMNSNNKKYEEMCEKNKKLEEKISYLEKEISDLKAKTI